MKRLVWYARKVRQYGERGAPRRADRFNRLMRYKLALADMMELEREQSMVMDEQTFTASIQQTGRRNG